MSPWIAIFASPVRVDGSVFESFLFGAHVLNCDACGDDDIAYSNKQIMYAVLNQAASETLRTIAADPRHLGAQVGLSLALNTWGWAMTHASASVWHHARR